MAKKISSKLTSLLVRARTADTSSTQAIRREFKTGELVLIRNTPWINYSLNEDDLNKLKQIKHLVGPVLKERQRKKQGKKGRAGRRLKHHSKQPDILVTANQSDEIPYYENLAKKNCGLEHDAEISQINVTCEVKSQAA